MGSAEFVELSLGSLQGTRPLGFHVSRIGVKFRTVAVANTSKQGLHQGNWPVGHLESVHAEFRTTRNREVRASGSRRTPLDDGGRPDRSPVAGARASRSATVGELCHAAVARQGKRREGYSKPLFALSVWHAPRRQSERRGRVACGRFRSRRYRKDCRRAFEEVVFRDRQCSLCGRSGDIVDRDRAQK